MYKRFTILMSIVAALSGAAEVYDSIVASFGTHAIKASDVDRDIRLTAFLNDVRPDFSPPEKRKSADRLIDQAIIRDEMAKSKTSGAAANPEPVLNRIKATRYRTDADYRQALQSYGISEAELKSEIAWQIAVIAWIDVRFGPQRSSTAQPHSALALAKSEQSANEAFFKWLDEARGKVRVQYRGELAK